LGGIGYRGHLEGGCGFVSETWFAGIAHDGGEFLEQARLRSSSKAATIN
jgi:hypothetical protein